MRDTVILCLLLISFCACKQKEARVNQLRPTDRGILVLINEKTGKTDTISYEKDSVKYLEYKKHFPIENGTITKFKFK